jgi:hypothetical protein
MRVTSSIVVLGGVILGFEKFAEREEERFEVGHAVVIIVILRVGVGLGSRRG